MSQMHRAELILFRSEYYYNSSILVLVQPLNFLAAYCADDEILKMQKIHSSDGNGECPIAHPWPWPAFGHTS